MMINYTVVCRYPEWLLVRSTDEKVVGSYASREEALKRREYFIEEDERDAYQDRHLGEDLRGLE